MLTGIAKLAQSGASLENKRRVEYRQLPTRRWINRCDSPRMPFRWTINPYRGCEYACRYCYARYTHEYLELRDPVDFETRIFAKDFDPAAFRRELRAIPAGQEIALGTATDPWQPAERRFERTRRMLEVFARERGLGLVFTTKSDLCARDLDLLLEIARRHRLRCHFTITTSDPRLARALEPAAPRPDLRFQAAAALARAGLHVGVFASPVLPGLNDSPENLDSIASGAAAIGARWFGAQPLFLQPAAQAVFFPFLDRYRPGLSRRYRSMFRHSAYLRGEFEDSLRGSVAALRERYGLRDRGNDGGWPEPPQMWLIPPPAAAVAPRETPGLRILPAGAPAAW
jgi:DNA repair photolyase